ncbi:hypothetical protein WA158_005416 [Blastocystis sp. Blastoise]
MIMVCEKLTLYEGDEITGVIQYQWESKSSSVGTITESICLLPKRHTIVMESLTGNGWGDASNENIYTFSDSRNLNFVAYMPYHIANTYFIDYLVVDINMIRGFGTEYKYLFSDDIEYSWTSSDFDDSTWLTTSSYMPSSSLFLLSRNPFTIDDSIVGLRIYVKAYYSFHIFVNGREVGLITILHNTNPDVPFSKLEPYIIIVPRYYLLYTTTTNIVCLLFFASRSSTIMYEYSVTTIVSKEDYPITIQNSYLFGAMTCKAVETPSCDSLLAPFSTTSLSIVGNTLTATLTVANRTILWFNQYVLSLSHSMATSISASWNVYGVTNGYQRIVLDRKRDIQFTSTYTSETSKLYTSNYLFSQVTLELYDVDPNNFKVDMFGLFINNFPYQPDTLLYNSQVNLYVGKEPVFLYPYTNVYTSFSVQPQFPAGIEINEETGTIAVDLWGDYPWTSTYKITAIHSQEQTNSSFFLTVYFHTCLYPQYIPVYIQWQVTNTTQYSYTITSFSNTVLHSSTTPYYEPYTYLCIPAADFTVTLYYNGISPLPTNDDGPNNRLFINLRYEQEEQFLMNTISFKGSTTSNNTTVPVAYPLYYGFYDNLYIDQQTINNRVYTELTIPDTPFKQGTPSVSRLWILKYRINIPNIETFVGYEIKIHIHGGFVFYLGSQEVFRYNVERGDISDSLGLLNDQDQYIWYTFFGDLQFFSKTNNWFLFFILNPTEIDLKAVDFQMTYRYIPVDTSLTSLWSIYTTISNVIYNIHRTPIINNSSNHSNTLNGTNPLHKYTNSHSFSSSSSSSSHSFSSSPDSFSSSPSSPQNTYVTNTIISNAMTTSTYSNPLYLFDQNYYTYFIFQTKDISKPVNISIEMDLHMAIYFNMYCIISSYSPSITDPSNWNLYGVLYTGEEVLLDTQLNVHFSIAQERKCFYIPTSTSFYTKIIIRFLHHLIETATTYSISDIEFYIENLSNKYLTKMDLYISSLDSYYLNNIPVIYTKSPYYYKLFITPSPKHLLFDTSTATLYGVVKEDEYDSFIISGYALDNTTVSKSISFHHQYCYYPYVDLSIVIYTNIYGYDYYFKLSSFTSGTLFSLPSLVSNYTQTIHICHVVTYFSISLYQKIYIPEGYIDIQYKVGDIIYKHISLTGKVPNLSGFFLSYIITPSNLLWKINNDNYDFDPFWMNSYNDKPWTRVISKNIPIFHSNTIYVISEFTLENIATYDGLYIEMTSSYAYTFYINGREIIRLGLPEGPLTKDTLAFEVYPETCVQKRLLRLGDIWIPLNKNVTIAIEFHRTLIDQSNPLFSLYISLPSVTILRNDGLYAYSKSKESNSMLNHMLSSPLIVIPPSDSFDDNDPPYSLQNVNKIPGSFIKNDYMMNLFLTESTDVYITGPDCIGTEIYFIYEEGHREIINSYSFTSGPTCNMRHPSSWVFEGSNEEDDWIVLDYRKDIVFTLSETVHFELFTYDTPYKAFRFRILECANQSDPPNDPKCLYELYPNSYGFQLNSILLYHMKQEISCTGTDSLSDAIDTGYAYGKCPIDYVGFVSALCNKGEFTFTENYCQANSTWAILYPNSIYQFYLFQSISPLIPSRQLSFAYCSITPELPRGLLFNTTNAAISGTFYFSFSPIEFSVLCRYNNDVAKGSVTIGCSLSFQQIMYIVLICIGILLIAGLVILIRYISCCHIAKKKSGPYASLMTQSSLAPHESIELSIVPKTKRMSYIYGNENGYTMDNISSRDTIINMRSQLVPPSVSSMGSVYSQSSISSLERDLEGSISHMHVILKGSYSKEIVSHYTQGNTVKYTSS